MAEKKGLLDYLGFKNVIDQVKALVDTRVKLIKYEIKDELAKSMSNAIIAVLLINLLFFALLLISVGLCIYIGNELDNYFYGFAIMSGIYFSLFVVLLLTKDRIGLKEAIEKELNKVFGIDK